MSWADVKHHYIEQDDPEPPVLRRHCACGAFLPQTPQEHVREVPVDWEWEGDNEGNQWQGRIIKTEQEVCYTLNCAKCRRYYQDDAMYE